MDRTKLKNYAPKARRDFIRAVTDRAAIYGLTEQKIEPVTEKGDVAIIAGKAYPISVSAKRRALEDRIKRQGFEQTMEAMAYTWFNRLVAIRFMELHGYLEHGYRVLSHPHGNNTPEILEHAEHVDLPGLDKTKVIELKLDAGKENELYRMLLIAQCNALHKAMPFLFERIDDETELLLPDNLLHSDSLIRQLVNEIDDADWQEVEIIGWLYQFYISEKKDEVIGKVVKSEDIPAATQLFTPNWIVKYLVQNTLGRKWMATYPQSSLRQQMEYYIEPAVQMPEVQAQLKATTPESLNPEEITLLDPACGSGHILVEAYVLLNFIYQERGYRAKDIPTLILQKNLYGLEIDDRAAQLAAFALLMKARADDRRILDSDVKPNILAFQDSRGMNAADITHALNSPINKEEFPPSNYLFEEFEEEKTPLFGKKSLTEEGHVSQTDIACLLTLFENAKTFGSLIRVPSTLAAKLPAIEKRLTAILTDGDLTHVAARVIKPLLQQAVVLTGRYDAVVANPPYMGTRYFSVTLKQFIEDSYPQAKVDLYACFMQRNYLLTKPNCYIGMITIPNWMFLSSFEPLRRELFTVCTIDSLIHNGRGVFGSDFGSCSFIIINRFLPAYQGTYRKLFGKAGSVATNEELDSRFAEGANHLACTNDFFKIPGFLVAYWLSQAECNAFASNMPLHQFALPRQGLATTDDERFIRLWPEVSYENTLLTASNAEAACASNRKWFPLNKGGPFRRWYGNLIHVINWHDDGKELKQLIRERYGSPSKRIYNEQYYFREGITYSNISIAEPSFRFLPKGCVFSSVGQSIYPDTNLMELLGYLNSRVASRFLEVLSPTIKFEAGQIANLPFRRPELDIASVVRRLVTLFREDWNEHELSWEFSCSPLRQSNTESTVKGCVENHCVNGLSRLHEAMQLEEQINRVFITLFGLGDTLSPLVEENHVALTRVDREEDIKRLLSYAIGCMMGRYSLDRPGLIYAHSGNEGFDPAQYKTFPADQDGIIPLTDTVWFDDDATNRVIEFIGVAWPKERLEENLTFIADSLGPNKGEQPRNTICRYLAVDFFKEHLKTYKKRPIYWLFSSGKQRAFQCLVYLHRYNEGTLSRMRTEYVIPLQGKMSARIEQLAGDIAAATSSAFRSKLTKERDKLLKQQAELQSFDEKLRHYADLRISLDLDDGVKVNFGKFGDLLAEVKAITGGKEEE